MIRAAKGRPLFAAIALLLPTPALADGPIPWKGSVWWAWEEAHGPGCQEWELVRDDGFTSVERRAVETGDGWSREVRTFYNLTDDGMIYAPGYDYTWIVEPGPDPRSLPGERGAIGHVSPFEVVSVDGRELRWIEADLPDREHVWFRSRRACRRALAAPD